MPRTESVARAKLLEGLTAAKNKLLPVVDSDWVSRCDTMAVHGISTKDLERLNNVAMLGKKNNNTVGIFYPLENVMVLPAELGKRWVDHDLVPESRLRRQMKPQDLNIEELQKESIWGRLKGRKGPETRWYSEETLHRILAVSVIPVEWKEGVDFLAVRTLPEGQDQEVEIRYAIPNTGRFRQAAYYYWGRMAVDLVREEERPRQTCKRECKKDGDQEEMEERERMFHEKRECLKILVKERKKLLLRKLSLRQKMEKTEKRLKKNREDMEALGMDTDTDIEYDSSDSTSKSSS